ncbi:MAG: HDOD domain-containing protein [Zoogloeaceae bacterium]|jgi:HD-like signal output (HDOD) protein|nr:HDOD domain-containing protein [Zoogloeaceae bacterium]
MSSPVVFKILESIANDLSGEDVSFPTFLDITFQVRMALRSPDFSMDKLAKLVSAEPLMSAQIVRMANSVALNPGGREVADVKTAILRVGTDTVRTVSYAVAMRQMTQGKEMLVFKDLPKRLWEHSAHVAALCRALVKRFCKGEVNEDEALFTGLVHDIGAFYLLSRAARFPELVEDHVELNAFLSGWHDSISYSLLSALGQSENVLSAVQEHEQAREIKAIHNLSDLLYVANQIANLLSPWLDPVESSASDILSELFDADTLQTLLGESETEINDLKTALGV